MSFYALTKNICYESVRDTVRVWR